VRRLALLIAVLGAFAVPHAAAAAPWCVGGESPTDRFPDFPAGAEVHAVYAIPNDGVDNFATFSQQIVDDVTRIDAWWRAQDPTRTLRFDLAPSSTCSDLAALDITFVRLNAVAGELVRNTYPLVRAAIPPSSGLDVLAKRYLVYYDGPVTDPTICGVASGGRFAKEGGVALVIARACPGVGTVVTAAHELLHALGALPTGALNVCPNDRGHPCDSQQDILYPVATGTPFEGLRLDVNHDDYYAHAGSWFDLQDSALLRRLDAAPVELAVGLTGEGRVVSDLPGLDCTAACATAWDTGTHVQLHAEGASGVSRFVRWSGACGGPSDCTLELTGAASATAVFGPLRVPVRVGVTGRGRVSCTPRCTTRFAAGVSLTLRAVASKGWRFTGWAGACRGTRLTCRPATDFGVTARAVFEKRR
jgi:Divergent InlB B-repeat domain